ncbi:Probable transcriptional regulator, AraC family [Mycobacteroides abscessus subsp. abscessus]|nr:Probable transcriptional regulator, AraC family [Mycobacteroides abscessus subsp. abscessus]
MAGAVLDLLATALCEYATPLTATARVHAEDLRRVQHLMARRMHDPDQTLTEVGAELGSTWLYDLRLARARTLLLDTDRTVADISVQVGFRDVSHFSRAFRRRFGASPAHFRAQRAVGS